MHFWDDEDTFPFEDHLRGNSVRRGSLLELMVKVSGLLQGKRWVKISHLFVAEGLPADPASHISGIRRERQCFSLYLETRDLYTFKTSYNLLSKNSWWLGDFNQEMKAEEVLLPQDRKEHLIISLSLVCKANLKTDASIFGSGKSKWVAHIHVIAGTGWGLILAWL